MMLPTSAKSFLVVAIAAMVVLPGCNAAEDDERGIGDQPVPATDTFEQGVFDDIPLFPRSEELAPRTEKDDVVTQSFRARDVSPERLLSFYERRLESSWNVVTDAFETGPGTFRGKWARDQWVLTVSASKAPALEEAFEGQALYAQYSLSLAPE